MEGGPAPAEGRFLPVSETVDKPCSLYYALSGANFQPNLQTLRPAQHLMYVPQEDTSRGVNNCKLDANGNKQCAVPITEGAPPVLRPSRKVRPSNHTAPDRLAVVSSALNRQAVARAGAVR